MIEREVFFNDQTINIFTDASVRNHGDITESVAGSISVLPDNIVQEGDSNIMTSYTRLMDSTNNEGEIYAIYLGLLDAAKIRRAYPDAKYTINLFSDSKISLIGLREWYLGWIRNSMSSDVLISSSGDPVKNQEMFIRCINFIINNNLDINMYHLRGHIDPKVNAQYYKFLFDFVNSNHLTDKPSSDLITSLAEFNNLVDYNTGVLLFPEGASYDIPTITLNRKFKGEHYKGLEVKPDFIFKPDMRSMIQDKKRYASLIAHNRTIK